MIKRSIWEISDEPTDRKRAATQPPGSVAALRPGGPGRLDLVARDAARRRDRALEMTAKIVSAHISSNAVPLSDLPSLIRTVHEALASPAGTPAPLTPVVPIKKSVTPNYIVCLEDGNKLKMLKRHLKADHNMTPKEYRERWGLPADYPMVAASYAERRSVLAKKIGLGTKARRGKAKAVEAKPDTKKALSE